MSRSPFKSIIHPARARFIAGILCCWCGSLGAQEIDFIDSTTLQMIVTSSKGDIQGVQELLQRGMDIESTDLVGNTPLIFAARYGRNDEVRFLIARGANVNARSRTGGTPLREAVNKMDVETVRLLLDAGAKVDVKDAEGETALFYAVRHGFLQGLEMLLAHGAAPNVVNNHGDTSLMYAVRQDVPWSDHGTMMISTLIMKGADPNLVNHKRESAVCLAKRYGNSTIEHVLLEYGANENSCSDIAGELIGTATTNTR